MSLVLISGITGFVGSNLKLFLKKEFEIMGITRNPKESGELSYDEINNGFLNCVDVFIHLAGKAHDLKKITSDQEYYEINTELTISVFDKFLNSNCTTFIFMSTVKAAADTVNGILTEEKIPNPITVYGKSKLKAEQYILAQKLPEHKRVYILRPCMIHGPNNKGNLNLLYKIISNNIPYPLGAFQNKRSFLAIDNLCFVIQKLIKKRPESGVFNVADDTAISTNELVSIIGDVIGKKTKIMNIPKGFVKLFASFGNVLPLALNTERLEKLTENYCVSNEKIKRTLGEQFPMNTYKGFHKTIKSFKN